MLENVDPLVLYFALCGVVKLAFMNKWLHKRPQTAQPSGWVTRLTLYPLKSAKGMSVQELECSTDKGPQYKDVLDRRLMIVPHDYKFLNCAMQPRISIIQPKINGSKVTMSAPGYDDLHFDLEDVEKDNIQVTTMIQLVPVPALDCGDEPARWLTDVLQKPGFRFIHCGSGTKKRSVVGGSKRYDKWTVEAKQEDKIAFQESVSFHLNTEESFADANSRLAEKIDIRRFRPNIVVSSGAPPYAEDSWDKIYVGDVCFKVIKPGMRCQVTCVNPDTGLKHPDLEPLKTLATFRSFVRGRGPSFGLDMVVDRPGTIRVGDPIYVIRGENKTLHLPNGIEPFVKGSRE